MHSLQRAVPTPQAKIAVHRAAWRQVLRDVSPLATSAQNIDHAIDHLAQVDSALAATTLGRQWFDMLRKRRGGDLVDLS
jgi:hypothetical protein